MAKKERCESGCDPKIAPVVIHDSEGIPLCIGCWNSMIYDAHREEVQKLKKKIRDLRERNTSRPTERGPYELSGRRESRELRVIRKGMRETSRP